MWMSSSTPCLFLLCHLAGAMWAHTFRVLAINILMLISGLLAASTGVSHRQNGRNFKFSISSSSSHVVLTPLWALRLRQTVVERVVSLTARVVKQWSQEWSRSLQCPITVFSSIVSPIAPQTAQMETVKWVFYSLGCLFFSTLLIQLSFTVSLPTPCPSTAPRSVLTGTHTPASPLTLSLIICSAPLT